MDSTLSQAGRAPLSTTARQRSQAAERNRQPILDVLQRVLPAQGRALEIASGTGQHIAFFGTHLPAWTWQPSDAVDDAFGSIAAWVADAGATHVAAPVVLDVMAPCWPAQGTEFEVPFDAIFCANMLHIAPWETCAALMRGAARYLAARGLLVTYGPYLESGVATAQSNLDFDRSLRQRNPAWGIRALEDVAQQAALCGLVLLQRHAMPANNLMLVFGRVHGASPTPA